MSNGYNGWANWETWNFFLHEGNVLQEIYNDLKETDGDLEYGQVYEIVNGYIDQMLEVLEAPTSGIFSDFIGRGIAQLDIHEIAEALMEDQGEIPSFFYFKY